MSDFIITPGTTSFSKAKEELIAFLDGQPDASQWSVFFQSPSGVQLVDIVSSLLAMVKYDTIAARRESFIQFALNRSSVIGAAQNLGYSAFRGRNAVLKLNVTPSSSGTWSKYDIIGTVKDRDLIVAEDTVYNAGVPVDVTVIVGELKTETIISTTDELARFRFTQKGVSDDLRLYIDGTIVEHSPEILELLNGKFQVQTNPVGSVDAKYLNQVSFATTYAVGSEIVLEWIDLKDVTFDLTNVSLDATEGTLNSSEITTAYQSPESENSIVVNAPVAFETKFVIRAREDQPKLFKTLDTSIIDATGEDVTAAVMRIYYLRDDRSLFDADEKTALIEAFSPYRPLGISLPIIGDPTRLLTRLKVSLVLANALGDPISDTAALITPLQDDLNATINLEDLEASIEALSNIKIARIEYDGDDWVADTAYEIGQMVKASPDTGRIYEVVEHLYFSDSVEPTWPIVEAGETVTDNELIWKSIPKDDLAGIDAWTADTSYKVGDQVKPTVDNGYIYEVTTQLNFSDAVEPTWTPLAGGTPEDIAGSLVTDGNIVWVARESIGTPSAWSPSTAYSKGDIVEATDPVSSDTVGVMWQVYAYVRKSDAAQPAFPSTLGDTVIDNAIVWNTVDPSVTERQAGKGEYFVFDDIEGNITVD